MDFRSSLIFMGQGVFESALEDPDSLVNQDDATLKSLDYEGLLYVPRAVYEAKTGADLDGGDPQPAEPAGETWDEDDEAALKALCPRLFERFW